MSQVPLFEFELARVENIAPWESKTGSSLSWFALTDGSFRMPVGDQVLFEYSDEIMTHWKARQRAAGYQVAAFARDVLGNVAAGTTRLPERIERLASNWDLLWTLQKQAAAADTDEAYDLSYVAWRWLGERSPWASYLVANPSIQFVRIGDDVHIHWDNRDRVVDGIRVWAAEHGVHVLPVAAFVAECKDFAQRLLSAMDNRLASLETGVFIPRVPIDTRSLREQHESWRNELASYFHGYSPDIPWSETERALRIICEKNGQVF